MLNYGSSQGSSSFGGLGTALPAYVPGTYGSSVTPSLPMLNTSTGTTSYQDATRLTPFQRAYSAKFPGQGLASSNPLSEGETRPGGNRILWLIGSPSKRGNRVDGGIHADSGQYKGQLIIRADDAGNTPGDYFTRGMYDRHWGPDDEFRNADRYPGPYGLYGLRQRRGRRNWSGWNLHMNEGGVVEGGLAGAGSVPQESFDPNDELIQFALKAIDPESGMDDQDRQAILQEFEAKYGDGAVEVLEEMYFGHDEVPAMLTPGEVVIPKNDVIDAGGPESIMKVVEELKMARGGEASVPFPGGQGLMAALGGVQGYNDGGTVKKKSKDELTNSSVDSFLDDVEKMLSASRKQSDDYKMNLNNQVGDERFDAITGRYHERLLPYASVEHISPFDEAAKVYGKGLGGIMSSRFGQFYQDKVGKTLPDEIYSNIPSMSPRDWSTKVPIGQLRSNEVISGSSGITTDIDGLGIGIALSGENKQANPLATRAHEMAHALYFMRKNRPASDLEKINAPLKKQNYAPDSYYKILRNLHEDTGEEVDFKNGWISAKSNPQESIAYLSGAIRNYASEKGAPPETEEEVIEALDIMIKQIKDDPRRQFHHGIYSGLKHFDWVKTIGQYLVKNDARIDSGGVA